MYDLYYNDERLQSDIPTQQRAVDAKYRFSNHYPIDDLHIKRMTTPPKNIVLSELMKG